MSTTINLQVSANEDDGYSYSGGYNFTDKLYTNLMLIGGAADTLINQGSLSIWMLFKNVAVPQGVTILESILTYTSVLDSTDVITTKVYANDVDNAVAPTSYNIWQNKVRTTAYTDWALGSWLRDTEYDSPDIKSVIQEVVNRVGWVSGNDILILHNPVGTIQMGRRKRPFDYNDDSAKATKLEITYFSPIEYTKTLTGTMNLSGSSIVKTNQFVKTLTGLMNVTGTVDRYYPTPSYYDLPYLGTFGIKTAQEGAQFDIIVTGTFVSFKLTFNGKTLVYLEDVISQTITIDNINKTVKNGSVNKMSKFIGDFLYFNNKDLNSQIEITIYGTASFQFIYREMYA